MMQLKQAVLCATLLLLPLTAVAQDSPKLPDGGTGAAGTTSGGVVHFAPTSDPNVFHATGTLTHGDGSTSDTFATDATLSGNVLTYTIHEKVQSFVGVLEGHAATDQTLTYSLTLPANASPAGSWSVAGAFEPTSATATPASAAGWASAPTQGGVAWQQLTRQPDASEAAAAITSRAVAIAQPEADAMRNQEHARFGVLPKRWLGYLQPPSGDSVAAAVLAANEATGNRLDPAWLYTVAIGEGLNGYLDAKNAGEKPELDGFQYLGTDTFGTRAAQLRAQGYLPKDFVAGKDYGTEGNLNEHGEKVLSGTFKTLPGGLTALAAMLLKSQDEAMASAKEIWGPNVQLTPDEVRFWAYMDFNVGPGEKTGVRSFMRHHPPTWGDSRPGAERQDQVEARYNSILRVAGARWLDDLGVFDPKTAVAPAAPSAGAASHPTGVNQPLGGD